ncbi:TetR/AcrR family transcriptional regulator [Dyadobacter psychrotolerans]|uniref:TetR/AcrR family transcriptional regulator n=1 Tax=Dyadobacter psychrotolerans TaxID=2541721 RepID=A0A4V2Z2L0_9BACT|nr:TetR/AcrR family transcriptional regulator [Dyadobacter psychrotolerans]TDE09228.1 TetR/AcrR family transcriptional regulator [Dyadobacter psychrotolerans]
MHNPHHPTLDRIMEAAEELLAKTGYGSVSVRDICKITGTNISTLYYHFGSKEGLIRHIFKERLNSLEEFPLWKIDKTDAEQNLHEFIHIVRLNVVKFPYFISICMQILTVFSENTFLNFVRQIRNSNVQTLYKIIQKGVDSGKFKAPLDSKALEMWVTGYVLSLLESQQNTEDTELHQQKKGLEVSLMLEKNLIQSIK